MFYEVCGEGGDVCKETVADLLSKLQVPVETEASWNVGEGGGGGPVPCGSVTGRFYCVSKVGIHMSSPHVNERRLSDTQNTCTSKSSHDKRNMSVSENVLYTMYT